MPFLEHVCVVIRQLLARHDRADRFNPNVTVIDHRVAVWIAGMIDETRFVPIHGRVDNYIIVDRE